MSMISMIVGRCHVSQSNLSVIRYVLSRTAPGWFRQQPRRQRHKLLREIIREHQANRDLFTRYRF